nr:hypothetical protein [uncultured Gellertiella sp.]
MRAVSATLLLLALAATPVIAQDATPDTQATPDLGGKVSGQTSAGAVLTMGQLLDKGYVIKAAVPSGTDKVIIYMQNEKSAYACEFTNVVKTRCGSIN